MSAPPHSDKSRGLHRLHSHAAHPCPEAATACLRARLPAHVCLLLLRKRRNACFIATSAHHHPPAQARVDLSAPLSFSLSCPLGIRLRPSTHHHGETGGRSARAGKQERESVCEGEVGACFPKTRDAPSIAPGHAPLSLSRAARPCGPGHAPRHQAGQAHTDGSSGSWPGVRWQPSRPGVECRTRALSPHPPPPHFLDLSRSLSHPPTRDPHAPPFIPSPRTWPPWTRPPSRPCPRKSFPGRPPSISAPSATSRTASRRS